MITDKNSIIKIRTETDGSAIVTVDSESKITKADFTIRLPSGGTFKVDMRINGKEAIGDFRVSSPKLWNPNTPFL